MKNQNNRERNYYGSTIIQIKKCNHIERAMWKYEGIETYFKYGKCPFCAERDTPEKPTCSKVFEDKFDKVP